MAKFVYVVAVLLAVCFVAAQHVGVLVLGHGSDRDPTWNQRFIEYVNSCLRDIPYPYRIGFLESRPSAAEAARELDRLGVDIIIAVYFFNTGGLHYAEAKYILGIAFKPPDSGGDHHHYERVATVARVFLTGPMFPSPEAVRTLADIASTMPDRDVYIVALWAIDRGGEIRRQVEEVLPLLREELRRRGLSGEVDYGAVNTPRGELRRFTLQNVTQKYVGRRVGYIPVVVVGEEPYRRMAEIARQFNASIPPPDRAAVVNYPHGCSWIKRMIAEKVEEVKSLGVWPRIVAICPPPYFILRDAFPGLDVRLLTPPGVRPYDFRLSERDVAFLKSLGQRDIFVSLFHVKGEWDVAEMAERGEIKARIVDVTRISKALTWDGRWVDIEPHVDEGHGHEVNDHGYVLHPGNALRLVEYVAKLAKVEPSGKFFEELARLNATYGGKFKGKAVALTPPSQYILKWLGFDDIYVVKELSREEVEKAVRYVEEGAVVLSFARMERMALRGAEAFINLTGGRVDRSKIVAVGLEDSGGYLKALESAAKKIQALLPPAAQRVEKTEAQKAEERRPAATATPAAGGQSESKGAAADTAGPGASARPEAAEPRVVRESPARSAEGEGAAFGGYVLIAASLAVAAVGAVFVLSRRRRSRFGK